MKKTLFVALAGFASAAPAEPPPQQIDIHNLPGGAKVVDAVVVPVPTEIFGVLDKLGRPAWHEVLRPVKNPLKVPAGREQTALLLGTVIAEGFIAVEDQNAEEVKNIGRAVLTLCEALNVRKVVVPRSNAITQGAEQHDWPQVRRELDKAQHEVQMAMQELSDEALSQMVSLGGWLRGTEALTEVVKQKYNPAAAELLHQPVLLDFFIRRIESFKPRMRDNPLVLEVKEGLQRLRPLMGTDESVITEDTVDKMHAITERLLKSIHAKNP